MIDNVITKDRLRNFKNSVEYLISLKNDKKNIESKLTIQGIDYSKDRVTSGSKKTSEQERYIIALERINNQISNIESIVNNEALIIKNQLNRLIKPIHRKIIYLKYIENWKIWEIIEDLYIGDPRWNPNLDLEEFKKSTDYELFRNEFYKLEKTAIKNLEEISGKPFVKNQNQLRIF